MRLLKRPLLISMAAASVLMLSVGMKVSDSTGEALEVFAETYLETLDEQQRSTTVKAYEDASRSQWHFVPKDERKGLAISQMNDAQSTAALRLVRAALSEVGYRKVNQIRLLESVVADFEGPKRRWARDPAAYYLTLFGQPGPKSAWGMSFEGHHVSLNLVCRGGRVVDSTPQFLGSHPAVIPDDYRGPLSAGARVLAEEEDLAFELIGMMTSAQRSKAIIADKAPAETRFAGESQAVIDNAPLGVKYSDLASPAQQLLRRLIHVYTDVAVEEIAADRLSRIEADGWDNIHFAWMGATKPGVGHAYRIRGESFLIELVNSQPDAMGNPANHLHTILRDLTGDFDLPNH